MSRKNQSLGKVSLRFYAELSDLLPQRFRQREFSVELFDRRSVKDLIESFQIPHTEVDLILINGTSVGFEAMVKSGDRISVYPVFEGLDITSAQRLRPESLRRPAFVCDVHLGTLTKKLRLLGIDTWYGRGLSDEQIVSIQIEQRRAILTCDRGLLQRNQVYWGYLVRSRRTHEQVVEVLRRFDLRDTLRPFTRCSGCNALLVPADPSVVEESVPAKVRKSYRDFKACPGCNQLYWQGSHLSGIEGWLRKIKGAW